MNHEAKHLIEEAIKALESSNLDAAWHFLRRAQGAVHHVAAEEREACAKVCENEWSNVAERMYGQECATAIRARANQ